MKSKTKIKKSVKKAVEQEVSEVYQPPVFEPPVVEQKPQKRSMSITTMSIIGLVGVLLGIMFAYQGNPVAAIVNGQPVFKWELGGILLQRYGQQTLQGIITEKLIASEASKQGVSISQSDIDTKAKEILSSFGSTMSVEEFLKFQGMERKEFDNQLKLQLTVENLLTKDLKISDDDVRGYIATNQATLTATDPAKLNEEARRAIREEKISESVQTWLEQLKTKASIQSFL